LGKLGLSPDTSDRAVTAGATSQLVQKLSEAADANAAAVLAAAEIKTTESAMGDALSKSSQLLGTLTATNWEIFDALTGLGSPHSESAKAILTDMREAIGSDEHVMALGPALTTAQSQALRLITEAAKPTTTTTTTTGGGQTHPEPKTLPPVTTPPKATKTIVSQKTETDLDLKSTRELIDRLERESTSDQSIRLSLSWIVEE